MNLMDKDIIWSSLDIIIVTTLGYLVVLYQSIHFQYIN